MALLKTLHIALIISMSIPSGQLELYQVRSAKSEQHPQNESSIDNITMQMRNAKVALSPPKNFTFFMITSSEAVIGWLPPEVYPVYDVNTSLIDLPFNETFDSWNQTYSQVTPTANDSMPVSSGSVEDKNVTSVDVTVTPVTAALPEELCHSLDFFANYTVNINDSEEALKDAEPHLITLNDFITFNKNVITSSTDADNQTFVAFSQGCVVEYHFFYYYNNSEPIMVRVNASERPEVHLTSLKPDTSYTVFVAAVFISNRTLNSTSASFTTDAVKNEGRLRCVCDWHGTVKKIEACNTNSSRPCDCRQGYQGQFCELCAPGYYRTAPYFPCHRCPCSAHATREATCRFVEGFLKCGQCEVGYTGNMCHMCDYGYYRHYKYCVSCHCNNNHNRSKPFMCDVVTGACHCMFNASGMNCERCYTGFVGDPLHFRNCTRDESHLGVFGVLSQGVIAGICVGTVLFICLIVGCIIYWQMSKNPPNRPFWTVELKDDHEGVNFNTVPNDDFQIVDPKMTMDDMEFYEQQGGAAQSHSGGSAGKKYARLQEHV